MKVADLSWMMEIEKRVQALEAALPGPSYKEVKELVEAGLAWREGQWPPLKAPPEPRILRLLNALQPFLKVKP